MFVRVCVCVFVRGVCLLGGGVTHAFLPLALLKNTHCLVQTPGEVGS